MQKPWIRRAGTTWKSSSWVWWWRLKVRSSRMLDNRATYQWAVTPTLPCLMLILYPVTLINSFFLVPVTFFLFGFVETFYAHDYVVSKKVQFFLSVCRFFLFLSLLHQLGLPSTMLNRSAESSQPFLFMEENIQTFTINYDVRWGFWKYALPVKPENPTKCSVMTQGFNLLVRWTWAWKLPFEFSKLEVLGK